jgi:hypothetical protein
VETIIQKSEIHPAILEWQEFSFHHSAGKDQQSRGNISVEWNVV